MKLSRLIGFILSFSILASYSVYALDGNRSDEFDDSSVEIGVVGARYIPSSDKRVKTRIQNSSDKYDYDLFGREEHEYFPLQMGSGDYSVFIFENVADTRYRQIKTKSMKVDIEDPLTVFKASVQTINWNYDMDIIKKAEDICKDLKTDRKKVEAIHKFVVDSLVYDYEKIKKLNSTYVPDIEIIMQDGKGICYDYAAVFAAMLRSQDIPTKLIKGYSDYVKEYHAWNEVYLAGEKKWIVIDSTYDSVMKSNKKTYKMEKDKKKYRSKREY